MNCKQNKNCLNQLFTNFSFFLRKDYIRKYLNRQITQIYEQFKNNPRLERLAAISMSVQAEVMEWIASGKCEHWRACGQGHVFSVNTFSSGEHLKRMEYLIQTLLKLVRDNSEQRPSFASKLSGDHLLTLKKFVRISKSVTKHKTCLHTGLKP